MFKKSAVYFILLSIVLSACSKAHTSLPPPSPSPDNGSAATITVTDSKGEQSIPANPEKVAVTYFALTELLLALEHPPVAANYFDDFVSKFEALRPYYADAVIEDIGSYNEINMEKLIAVGPNLIIAAGAENDPSGNDLIYDQLRAIAPVFYMDALKLNEDWRWGLSEVAKALNAENKAKEVIADIDKAILQAKRDLADVQEQSVLFVDVLDNGFYVWGVDRLSGYYDGLELSPPDSFNGQSGELSLEGLSVLNPDHLFVHYRPDANTADKLTALKGNRVWDHLQAVENGRVHLLESSAFSPGPIGVQYGVAAIAKGLAGNG